jgi:hypothetical protein
MDNKELREEFTDSVGLLIDELNRVDSEVEKLDTKSPDYRERVLKSYTKLIKICKLHSDSFKSQSYGG